MNAEADIHINQPSSTRYIARVRRHGHRNYELVSKPLCSMEKATVAMAKAFAKGGYERGDVILVADYYDPKIVVRISS